MVNPADPAPSLGPTSLVGEAFGRYRLVELVARGATGQRYRAKRQGAEGFQKTLAVKRIAPELAADPRFSEVFLREARLSMRLGHANVAQVIDLGSLEQRGQVGYFVASEWVPGLDLGTLWPRLLARRVPLLPVALHVAARVALALDHAHRRADEQGRLLGIAHGDLGPASVLCSFEGDVKVADFGLVSALYALAGTGAPPLALASKVESASPEQLRGEPITARSDLFAFGSLLYWMVAGRGPFAGPGRTVSREAVLAGAHPPLSEVARVPPALAELVEACLAVDAATRPASAAAVHEALTALSRSVGQRFGASELGELIDALSADPDPGEALAESLPPPSVDVPASSGGWTAALHHSVPPPSVRGGVRLVGRRAEFAVVARAISAAAKRQPQLVWVTGPAGAGKSRLLAELGRRIERSGFAVVCRVATLEGPAAPRSAARALADAVEIGAPLGSERPLHLAVAEALRADPLAVGPLREALLALSADQVVVLACDEAGMLDAATLDALGAAAVPPGAPRVVVVVAARDAGGTPAAFTRHQVTLGPFELPQLEQLATAALAAPPPPALMAVLQRTSRLPGAVLDRVRRYQAEGRPAARGP